LLYYFVDVIYKRAFNEDVSSKAVVRAKVSPVNLCEGLQCCSNFPLLFRPSMKIFICSKRAYTVLQYSFSKKQLAFKFLVQFGCMVTHKPAWI